MNALWSLADLLEVAPMPADDVLRSRLSAWWAMPRNFGCVEAKSSPLWFVLWPAPDIYCHVCAFDRLSTEPAECVYCASPVTERGTNVIHESADYMVLLGHAHIDCVEAVR